MIHSEMLERKTDAARLFAFYGKLLTCHQQAVLTLYLDEDLSLSEIAEEMKITRQGVHDAYRQACAQLYIIEKKLGIAEQYVSIRQALQETLDALRSGDVETAADKINSMIHLYEGEA